MGVRTSLAEQSGIGYRLLVAQETPTEDEAGVYIKHPLPPFYYF